MFLRMYMFNLLKVSLGFPVRSQSRVFSRPSLPAIGFKSSCRGMVPNLSWRAWERTYGAQLVLCGSMVFSWARRGGSSSGKICRKGVLFASLTIHVRGSLKTVKNSLIWLLQSLRRCDDDTAAKPSERKRRKKMFLASNPWEKDLQI